MSWPRRLHRQQRRTLFLLLPLLWVLALSVGWGLTSVQLPQRIDKLIYDQRLRLSMPHGQDDRIVIVDIDEKSLAAHGQWPWPRTRLAQLTNEIFVRQQASVLGMDLVFVEKDNTSGSELVRRLARDELSNHPDLVKRFAELESILDHDAVFARALEGRRVVLGYYFTSDNSRRRAGVLPKSVLSPADLGANRVAMTHWTGYGANIEVLTQAAPKAGFFNALTDLDGVVRTLPVLAEADNGVYESLAMAVFRVHKGDAPMRAVFPAHNWKLQNEPALQAVRLYTGERNIDVPLDARARALVPYRGISMPNGQWVSPFKYVSADDLLSGAVEPGTLKGRIVLMGSTAPGLQDQRATPVSTTMPGVEVHAHLLSGMLDDRLAVEPDYAMGFNVLQLLLVGLLLAWWLPRMNMTQSLLLGAAAVAGVMGFNYWAFVSQRLVLPVALALYLIAAATMFNIAYGFFVERYVRRRMTDWFGTYVPQDLVHQMMDSDQVGTRALSRPMTVMFCDIRDFTAMSESMSPPQVQHLLGKLFSRQTRIIRDHGGTVDKYMGDCVMAFWGAPKEDPLHASHATAAALALIQDLAQYNRERAQANKPPVRVGIGLATGVMRVGDMGSDIRRNYTVIGDSVNLGARLQDLTKTYGVDILASQATREQSGDHVWQEIDRVRVKGRSAEEQVFLPVGNEANTEPGKRFELELWHEALSQWRNGQIDAFERSLSRLRSNHPGTALYAFYADKLAQHKESMAAGQSPTPSA